MRCAHGHCRTSLSDETAVYCVHGRPFCGNCVFEEGCEDCSIEAEAGRITQPGIFELTNADYQSQTDWLSSSMLKALLPERYKTGGSEDALLFGSLFHTVILEPDRLEFFAKENSLAILDADSIGLKADGKAATNPTSTAAWKEAVVEAEGNGLQVITLADWTAMLTKAQTMAEAVRAHDTAAELLFGTEGTAEESAFAVVEGVPCRARFDKRIPGAILDLKSTSTKPGKAAIARAVIDYGYDLSAAHYLAVAEELGLDVQGFGFVFVSKTEPHYVTVCDLDDAFLARGRALRALAIERYLNHAAAYEGASGYLTLNLPRWAELESA